MTEGLPLFREVLPMKTLTFAIVGLLLTVAVVVWGIVPAYEYRDELRSRQDRAAKLLDEIVRLKSLYRQSKQSSNGHSDDGRASADFSLFSFLENKAGSDGIKKHIGSMRPKTVESPDGLVQRQVQISLEKIRLVPLLSYLKHIEYAGKQISVQRMTIRSSKEAPGELRVDLLLSTTS